MLWSGKVIVLECVLMQNKAFWRYVGCTEILGYSHFFLAGDKLVQVLWHIEYAKDAPFFLGAYFPNGK